MTGTLEWSQGFEGCESDGGVRALFDQYSRISYSSSNGWDNEKCIRFDSGVGYNPYVAINCVEAKTKCVGCHVRDLNTNDYSTSVTEHLFRFTIGGSYIRVFNTTTGIKIYRDSTLIASSVTESTLITTNLHHIEFKLFSDASTGTIGFKIDGVSVEFDNDSSLNTGGDDISVCLFAPNGYHANSVYMDNMFIADDWIGELKHLKREAISDVSVDFTPSSGSDNYAMIETDNGDTDYNSSDTVGHKDLFEHEVLPSGIDVLAVTQHIVGRKDDVGTRAIQLTAREDSTDYDGDEFTLAADYPSLATEGQYQIHTTTPAGAALSKATVDPVYWGYEVSL